MTPHEYAVIGHKRSDVGRWLGLASLVLAPFVTSLVTWTGQLPFLNASVKGTLTAFTMSTGIVYITLYWVFNRYAWRCLDKILRIPDLNGRWEVYGTTLGKDGNTLAEWQRELVISQKWDQIAIELNTGQSHSYSESASLLVKHDNETKLSYSYQNHPRPGEPGLQKHQGFCELIFNADCTSAEGHYFNSLGRYTFGRLTLKKVNA